MPLSTNHSAPLHIVEHGNHGVPETVDVIKNHLFVVIADGSRGSHRKDLVKRPDASGQSNKHVALTEEQVLAVTQVITGDVDVDIVGKTSVLLDDGRYDTDGQSSRLVDRFSNTFHQSQVASSKDDGVPVLCNPLPELTGLFKVQ